MIRNKLQELGYQHVNDHWYRKVIKKINDYVDKNGNIVFTTTFLLGLYICLDNDETMVVDGFIRPLEAFKLRTEDDLNSFNTIASDFQKDLNALDFVDEPEIAYDA